MAPAQLDEHIFDVANQFNRGAARLTEPNEKTRVAAIDLRAGIRAKASAAPASACVYLAAGMAILEERDWENQYELMFSLWLQRAACEILSGNFQIAEQLIAELPRRAVSKIDYATACHLKILLHMMKSENAEAIDSTLACLRLFDIDLPARPTEAQVHAEYETLRRALDGRSIESLIDPADDD